MTDISIFIPVHNEEEILGDNVEEVYRSVAGICEDFEIFIVDDNSTDGSSRISEKISRYREIRYLRYNNGPSKRENLAQSFKNASGSIVAFIDADLPVNLADMPRLIGEINKGADISVGSRYVEGARVKRKIPRWVISFIYNKFLQIYLGSRIKDHQCGFKAFKRDVLLDLIGEMGYDKKFERRWFWDAELLIRAQRKNYMIAEFPVEWRSRQKNTFSIREEIRMIPYILRFRFR